MRADNLEAAIQRAGGAVELLRGSPVRPHTFPVAPEFTNWRSEQHAWRESCVVFDQSHHMTDLFIEGPGALALLTWLGVNRFEGFGVDRAKQFVAVSDEGHLIGDAILFHLDEDRFDLVGHPMVLDWVQFHGETGDFSVSFTRDDNSLVRTGPPREYRYELQGPAAAEVVARATGAPVPDLGFFHMGALTLAGHRARTLRHGMAGQPGFELFGPWAEGEAVLAALLEAGAPLGLVRAGSRAYSTANLESGWVPSPLPGIYHGDALRPYREWLPAAGAGSLGGSLVCADVRDYYVTPYDLGYGRTVSFDHDFLGRAALEALADDPPRDKVTLVWHPDDVAELFKSLVGEGLPAKYVELPKSRYALFQADAVLKDGRQVGISMDCGYLANEQAMVSLATIERGLAAPGTEVTLVWGEDPVSAKPQVEPHRQVPVRASVAPAPFARFARESYRR